MTTSSSTPKADALPTSGGMSNVKPLIDRAGQHPRRARQADQRRHLEGLRRLDEDEQAQRQQRRPRHAEVTCRSVENKPAPQMLAASSNDASELRNTGESSRKASGDHSRPSTKIIPPSE